MLVWFSLPQVVFRDPCFSPLADSPLSSGLPRGPGGWLFGRSSEGPKIQKFADLGPGIEISIENEIFERATHRGPILSGEIETSRLKFSSEIKNFDRDQKIRSGSNCFDRWAVSRRGAVGIFFLAFRWVDSFPFLPPGSCSCFSLSCLMCVFVVLMT